MAKSELENRLPELCKIEEAAIRAGEYGKVCRETVIKFEGLELPVFSFRFGSENPSDPTIAFIGGVHGLERIGTQITTAYLETILEYLRWDESLKFTLRRCRLLFYPLVNPTGMLARTRCNGNGVDLMRNAPIDAGEQPPGFLLGGHRLTPMLPWFRGRSCDPMEVEAKALCDFVERELFPSPFSISLDIHSGYGIESRIWFPYAGSRKPYPHLAETYALKKLLDSTLPNHVYKVEPQARHYLAHGDLYYLHYRQTESNKSSIFIPLCLELGSWLWVKKNPRQMLSPLGAFNPMLPHRTRRTLRRHLAFLDFLLRAASSYCNWLDQDDVVKTKMRNGALLHWFKK